ncbi:MAG: nitroreductase family protein [Ruminococcaceae bacterium]|nr:nitroreductase family protein [Oscillospiraceae bacterium]
MNETLTTILTRRSCRSYQDRPIPEDILDQVLLAGTYAPNGRGRQPGKIVVVRDKETIRYLEQLNAQVLGDPESRPFYGAPVVLVVLADRNVFTPVEDGSLVLGNLFLAAHSLGLGTCWIHRARQVFDSPEGKALLKKWGVSEDYMGIGHCIIGYPEGEMRPAAERKPDFIVKV